MELSQIGENALVSRLARNLPMGAHVLAGPGDDCAVVRIPGSRVLQLLKTDCVIEGVHFLASDDAAKIGWKALCRAISDVAACGGQPADALITIAAPADAAVKTLVGIYRGIRRAARQYGVSVVGGETARSPGPIFISVALTGQVDETKMALRRGGSPGDRILVTGRLGGSLGGRHLIFKPRVREGQWLAAQKAVRAMMDLSDGLAADLPRLAAACCAGFELDETAIPLHRGCSVSEGLNDGEDYELMVAVNPRLASRLLDRWRRQFPALSLTDVGRLVDSPLQAPARPGGFEHF